MMRVRQGEFERDMSADGGINNICIGDSHLQAYRPLWSTLWNTDYVFHYQTNV